MLARFGSREARRAGSAINVLIFGLAYYRILTGARKGRGRISSRFPRLQKRFKKSNEVPRIGRACSDTTAVSRRWLVKKSLLTFDFVSTKDVCWVYGKNTKHYINFIPTHTTYTIEAKLRSGKTLSVHPESKEKRNSKELELLHTLAPWAFFGYSDELKRAWGKNPD